MNELIITTNNESFPVSGRELHEMLQIDTPYYKWFPRMCEYGFVEGIDFQTNLSESTGGRPASEHTLSIDMSKHLCMIQRSPRGMEVRQYLINVENQWNSPDAVMARALKMAGAKLDQLRDEMKLLSVANEELKPKAAYCEAILTCPDAVSITVIAKDYGRSGSWLNNWLHTHGIQYKQGEVWLLYADHADQGYTCTRTHSYISDDGTIHSKIHTYWTQKRRQFIYKQLKNDGILLNNERWSA
ncbi:AntA/AntB antirepressor [Clostridia bacterium]|nr:AntA/AntB antirepressor [Clostridia bacterium]